MWKRIILFLLTQPSPSREGFKTRTYALKPSPEGEGWVRRNHTFSSSLLFFFFMLSRLKFVAKTNIKIVTECYKILLSATNLRRDKIQGQLLNSCIIKLMTKKTEPHKKYEQPAKQLLLKSLALAIKPFVNLPLLSIVRKVVCIDTFVPLKSVISIPNLRNGKLKQEVLG